MTCIVIVCITGGCEIAKAYAKNDAIVFVVSHAEAVKNGLVKED